MHVQSKYLLNMAYLRIKNITLGYSFEPSLLEKVMVKTARIYVALENFVTWDHLNGLPFDPEVINGYSMFNSSNYNLSRTGVGTPDRKSTRRTPVTNAHLVCRLLLDKKKKIKKSTKTTYRN